MPAKSKAQQKAAGAALSAKRGETKSGALKGASRQMFESMNETQLDELASTKRKGKPEHVDERKSAAKSSAKRAVKSRPRSAKVTKTRAKTKTVKKAPPRKKPAAKRTRQ